MTAEMQASAPDWRLKFRQIAWSDPTVGLADGAVDIAIAWLPLPRSVGLCFEVVAQEDRWVALPSGHRLAERSVVPFAEIAAEPAIALPASAGPLRAFWLAADARTTPAHVAAETETADEAFEAVATGLGIALVSEGNAHIYQRDDVVFRPLSGLAPSQLAVAWQAGDDRPVVHIVIAARSRCLCTTATQMPLG